MGRPKTSKWATAAKKQFSAAKSSAKRRTCPTCGAKGGSPCKSYSGEKITWIHRSRIEAA